MTHSALEWERMDRATVRAGQLERLKALLAHVSATNAFYREHWRKANVDVSTISSIEDFGARVPMVEKKDFIADQEAVPPYGTRLAHLSGEPLQVYSTSGTSGQGQEVHAQTEREMAGTLEVYAHMYRWSGLKRGDLVHLTLGMSMLAGGKLEYHGAYGYGLTVLPIATYDARQKIALLRRFKPKGIISTTSYLGHLSAVAEGPPAPGVTALYCGGEGASVAWYQRLEEEWGARCYDRYGSTQSRNDHMFSCEHGVGTGVRPGVVHNIDSHVLLEVVDPQTGKQVADGERGEIVITSLYHLDTPVIRCRMRDLATYRSHEYCACGRPYAGIEVGSVGRLDNMYRIKSVNVWPQAVEQALFEDGEVDDYQVRIDLGPDGADVATLNVMPKSTMGAEADAAFRARLVASLRERIGLRFVVETAKPGSIARSEYKAKRWTDTRPFVSDAARKAREQSTM